MSEKLKVTVERSRWLRGTPHSILLDSDTGKRCCLGFVLRQEGFADEQLADRATPRNVAQQYTAMKSQLTELRLAGVVPGGVVASTPWAATAMDINDDSSLSEDAREAQLLTHCARPDSPVEFEFVD